MAPATRVWLITGPPAIGKSTALSQVILQLRSRGLVVGGCIARERREGGARTGFALLDLVSGREGVLASAKGGVGPRLGKYRVNLKDLAGLAAPALLEASSRADVIAIDEIGPMELMSPEFRRAADACLGSGKPLVAVVHEDMRDPLAERFTKGADRALHVVTLENRNGIARQIAAEMLKTFFP